MCLVPQNAFFCLIIVVPTIANLDDNEYEDN